MATAPALQQARGWEGGPSCGGPLGHLPEVGDDPHRPVERRAQLLHSMSLLGHPVPPSIAGSPLSTPGPHLPDVSDAGDGALVDDFRAHELGGTVLAVLRLLRCQLLRIAEVTDPDLLTARIRHQEVFWLQDRAGWRRAWQEAGTHPREGMSPSAAQHGRSVPVGVRQEGAKEPRTHFDVQVQDSVLVQVADALQDLPHVGSDL